MNKEDQALREQAESSVRNQHGASIDQNPNWEQLVKDAMSQIKTSNEQTNKAFPYNPDAQKEGSGSANVGPKNFDDSVKRSADNKAKAEATNSAETRPQGTSQPTTKEQNPKTAETAKTAETPKSTL